MDVIGRDPDAHDSDRIQAIMGQARMLGFIVDRREIQGRIDHTVRPLVDWSEDELEAAVQRGKLVEEQLALAEGKVI